MELPRVVKIASRLVKQRSENPPGDERTVAEELEKIFRENGVEFERIVYGEKRVNLIAKTGEGGKRLLYVVHSDTVPAGGGWEFDPFGAVIREGRLYGRGAQDDKGQAACAIEAMLRVKERVDGELWVAVTADEEAGGEFGLKRLLKEERIDADAAVLVDAGKDVIDVAEKGPLWLKLKARGKSAHGAYPERGENAIMKMVSALKKLEGLELEGEHELLGKATLNVGTIRGGEKTNMVPESCEVTVDLRLLPGQSKEEAVESVKKRVKEIEVEEVAFMEPCEMEKESNIVKALSQAMEDVAGKAELKGVSGCTGLTLLPFPAVATGFGPDVAHSANEYINLDDLERGASVLEKTALLFLGEK